MSKMCPFWDRNSKPKITYLGLSFENEIWGHMFLTDVQKYMHFKIFDNFSKINRNLYFSFQNVHSRTFQLLRNRPYIYIYIYIYILDVVGLTFYVKKCMGASGYILWFCIWGSSLDTLSITRQIASECTAYFIDKYNYLWSRKTAGQHWLCLPQKEVNGSSAEWKESVW